MTIAVDLGGKVTKQTNNQLEDLNLIWRGRMLCWYGIAAGRLNMEEFDGE